MEVAERPSDGDALSQEREDTSLVTEGLCFFKEQTMAYLDAVRDAIEYTDTRDNANDRLIAAEQQIGSGIRELLTKTVRTVAVKNLSLPFPIVRGGALMVTKLDMEEVISDSVTSGNPMEALMAVFERSDCPLVAALREAVAADYIRRNASELAEVVA